MILTPEQIEQCAVVDTDKTVMLSQYAHVYSTLLAYAEIVQKVAESELDGLSLAHGIESRYLPDDVYLCARKLRGME